MFQKTISKNEARISPLTGLLWCVPGCTAQDYKNCRQRLLYFSLKNGYSRRDTSTLVVFYNSSTLHQFEKSELQTILILILIVSTIRYVCAYRRGSRRFNSRISSGVKT